jgi:hypothetical protein
MGADTVMASAMCLLVCVADTCQASSQSSITPVPALNIAAVIIERVVTVATDGRCEPVRVTGDWQLTADQVP